MNSWLIRLVNAALLVLAALVCAHWFWIFAAPAVTAPIETPAAEFVRPAEVIRRASLFGASASEPAIAPARTDLVLRGVYAARDGGMAVIALERGRTVTVRAGEEIAPGIKLERVLRDHVLVTQGGVSQRIELAQRTRTDTPPVAATGYPPRK